MRQPGASWKGRLTNKGKKIPWDFNFFCSGRTLRKCFLTVVCALKNTFLMVILHFLSCPVWVEVIIQVCHLMHCSVQKRQKSWSEEKSSFLPFLTFSPTKYSHKHVNTNPDFFWLFTCLAQVLLLSIHSKYYTQVTRTYTHMSVCDLVLHIYTFIRM